MGFQSPIETIIIYMSPCTSSLDLCAGYFYRVDCYIFISGYSKAAFEINSIAQYLYDISGYNE